MNAAQPFDVRIEFADGSSYADQVDAENSYHAFRLALKGAELARPFGSFASPVDAWEASLALEFA